MNEKVTNIGEGIAGAFMIAFAIITPFLKPWRTGWGSVEEEFNGSFPGDDIITEPKW